MCLFGETINTQLAVDINDICHFITIIGTVKHLHGHDLNKQRINKAAFSLREKQPSYLRLYLRLYRKVYIFGVEKGKKAQYNIDVLPKNLSSIGRKSHKNHTFHGVDFHEKNMVINFVYIVIIVKTLNESQQKYKTIQNLFKTNWREKMIFSYSLKILGHT